MSDTPLIPSDVALCLSYTDGMFLTAQNMTLEQTYFWNWITWQNRFLYTAGVLSGLAVTLQSNTLIVASGAAIDSTGEFLIFPDGSGNMMTPATGFGSTYGLYVAYPKKPVTTAQPNVVNRAAILQNGPASNDPSYGVILATVNLDPSNPGIIKSITDSRVGVTSKLPIVIAPAGADAAPAAPPNLSGARHGNVQVDTTQLLKPGDRTRMPVFYHPDKTAVFAMPPGIVNATVVGETPYAVGVSEIGTAQFVLTLTALQTRVDGTPTTQVNWIALP